MEGNENLPLNCFDEVVWSLIATKSSGYTKAFAVALPNEPETAWTNGGKVDVIFAGMKSSITVSVSVRQVGECWGL